MALTDREVRNTKNTTQKAIILQDRDGLFLRIYPKTGKKVYFLRYKHAKKEYLVKLGSVSQLSLQNARRLAIDTREEAIKQGIHPKAVLQKQDAKAKDFEALFYEYLSFRYANNTASMSFYKGLLNNYCSNFKTKSMDFVTKEDFNKTFETLRRAGITDSSKKLLSFLKSFYIWALQNDNTTQNPIILFEPKHTIINKPTIHHPHLKSLEEIKDFLKRLDKCTLRDKTLLSLLLYTAVRGNPARGIQWEEIDLKAGIWTVPAKRMKSKREFKVYLHEDLVNLLNEYKKESKNALLFSSSSKIGYITKDGLLAILRRKLGFKRGELDIHGLRGTFSTLANEYAHLEKDGIKPHKLSYAIIEKCLDHEETNAIRKAYNHAQNENEKETLFHWFGNVLAQLRGENATK